jgi:hypothetical protein
MSDQHVAPTANNTFERIKQVSPVGHESWSARELARVLEYLNFRNFQPVVEKAREACAKSGHAVSDHFADIRNMVDIGSGALASHRTARPAVAPYPRSSRAERTAHLELHPARETDRSQAKR